MGQGCPDTAACDTRYYGFFNQVYGAAWQLKRYAQPAGHEPVLHLVRAGKDLERPLQPGRRLRVVSGPHPEPGDGQPLLLHAVPAERRGAASRVRRGRRAARRTATATSTTTSRTGSGRDWFGSRQGDTLQVLQVTGTTERYVVSQGARWRLATPEMAAQFTWISPVRDVSRSDIDSYQDRGTAGRAIRTNSGIVYLLDSGQRLRPRDLAQVADFGWNYDTLPIASDTQAARYRDGGTLERVVRADGQSWLIQGGTRRQILDLGLLPRYGIPALATDISGTMMAGYPVSSPVVGVGVYRDATNAYRVLTDAGVFVLPDAATATAIGRSARQLAPEIDHLSAGDRPTATAHDLGGKGVRTPRGRMARGVFDRVPGGIALHRASEWRSRGHRLGRADGQPALHPRTIGCTGLPRLRGDDSGGLEHRAGMDHAHLRSQSSDLGGHRRRHRRRRRTRGSGSHRRRDRLPPRWDARVSAPRLHPGEVMGRRLRDAADRH